MVWEKRNTLINHHYQGIMEMVVIAQLRERELMMADECSKLTCRYMEHEEHSISQWY